MRRATLLFEVESLQMWNGFYCTFVMMVGGVVKQESETCCKLFVWYWIAMLMISLGCNFEYKLWKKIL